MTRPRQAPRSRFTAFSGVGRRLGGPAQPAPTCKVKKMKGIKKSKLAQFKATSCLKITPMGRIVSEKIKDAACADMMQKGLDWANKPRATRSKPATPAVTRKSNDSVVTISKEGEAMLTAVLGSANFATEHAKRKTLQVEDMHLVQSILGKSGSYAGLLGF